MRLGKNFPLSELIKSVTAEKYGINNLPTGEHEYNLFLLVYLSLQPLRDAFGRVDVTSGYRCPELNTEIKGSKTSDHMEGRAADIRTPYMDLREVYNWIVENLKFGQVIYESPKDSNPRDGRKPWIHISLPRINGKPNQQTLYWNGKTYSSFGGF